MSAERGGNGSLRSKDPACLELQLLEEEITQLRNWPRGSRFACLEMH